MKVASHQAGTLETTIFSKVQILLLHMPFLHVYSACIACDIRIYKDLWLIFLSFVSTFAIPALN